MITPAIDSKQKNLWAVSGAGLLLLIVLLYTESFGWLVAVWWNQPDYIYCFIVPFFSAWLIWDRRDLLELDQLNGSYWGVPVIILTVVMAVWCDYQFRHVPKAYTMIPLIAGVVLLAGGWHAMRWMWPAILFLTFMVPLPGRVNSLLAQQLQKIGTTLSVFVIQTLGIPAVADGNVIVLSESQLGVVEACAGLKMLMLFFAASIGAAFYLRHRDPITRIIIGLSAVPIAIIANVFRITVTAIIYEKVNPELGDKIFHDLAGWLMMPLAIALLWFETAILDRLFVAPEREAPIAFGTTQFGVPQRSGGPQTRETTSLREDQETE